MKKLFTLLFVSAGLSLIAQNFQIYTGNNPVFFTSMDVAPCLSGGYVSCGTDDVGIPSVIKTDANGNLIWAKNINMDFTMVQPLASSIGELIGGTGYYVLITDNIYNSSWYGNVPYVLAKLDVSGNVTSSQIYYTSYQSYMYWASVPSVKQQTNGNFLFNLSLHDRMAICCTNSTGTMLWDRTIVNDSIKNPSLSAVICNDGGVMALGKRFNDLHLVKTDMNGNVQWSKIFDDGGLSYTRGKDIIKTADGNMVIAGLAGDVAGFLSNGFLMKIDNAGNILWNKTYTLINDESFEKVLELPTGELVICGSCGYETFFLKTDATGNILLCNKVNYTNSYTDFMAMKLAGNNIIFTSYDSYCIFATDFTLDFSCCGQPYALTAANNTSYNPVIVTGQVTTTSAGMTTGTVNCTTSNFNLTLDNFCSLFSVNEVQTDYNISVYPNPMLTTSVISIEADVALTDAWVEIYDVTGRKTASSKMENNRAVIERNSLPSGMYFYKIMSADKEIASGKLSVL